MNPQGKENFLVDRHTVSDITNMPNKISEATDIWQIIENFLCIVMVSDLNESDLLAINLPTLSGVTQIKLL